MTILILYLVFVTIDQCKTQHVSIVAIFALFILRPRSAHAIPRATTDRRAHLGENSTERQSITPFEEGFSYIGHCWPRSRYLVPCDVLTAGSRCCDDADVKRVSSDPRWILVKPSKPSRRLKMQEKAPQQTQLPLIFHLVSHHDRVHGPHITQHLIPSCG
jgi:hypothetical protein